MDREPLVFGLAVLGVVAGLAVLLYGEASHGADSLVYVGGVIVLLSVGWMTGVVAQMPGSAGHD